MEKIKIYKVSNCECLNLTANCKFRSKFDQVKINFSLLLYIHFFVSGYILNKSIKEINLIKLKKQNASSLVSPKWKDHLK